MDNEQSSEIYKLLKSIHMNIIKFLVKYEKKISHKTSQIYT